MSNQVWSKVLERMAREVTKAAQCSGENCYGKTKCENFALQRRICAEELAAWLPAHDAKLEKEEGLKWVAALDAWPSALSDTRTMLVAKFADKVRAEALDKAAHLAWNMGHALLAEKIRTLTAKPGPSRKG